MSPSFGLPRGATAPAEAGREQNGYNKNISHPQDRNGEASEGGGGDTGATPPGDDDKGDGKLGIDLSASFVRLELKDFRGRQALMVSVIAASLKPICISYLRNGFGNRMVLATEWLWQPNGSHIHRGR